MIMNDHKDHRFTEDLDEVFAEADTSDDESWDDEASPLDVLRGVGGALLPFPFNAIANLAGGTRGVSSATLSTPRGTASMRLPEPVVTERAFKEAMQKVEGSLTALTGQVAESRKDITALKRTTDRKLSALQKQQQKIVSATKASIAKMHKQQSSQNMMNMLMTMMMQDSNRRALESHTHTIGAGTSGTLPVNTGTANNVPASDSSMLLLPMMMGDSGGGGSDNNMMMMMMMMMSQKS